jgi:hypothetical protein
VDTHQKQVAVVVLEQLAQLAMAVREHYSLEHITQVAVQAEANMVALAGLVEVETH